MKLSKTIVIGLMCLFLQACSVPLTIPQTISQKPDPAWTEQVPTPIRQGNDNAALASWAKALRDALAVANANLAAIKQWAEAQ